MSDSTRTNKLVTIPCPTVRKLDRAHAYFESLALVLNQLPFDVIDQITAKLVRAYNENRKVLLFGNGGSASLASHSACDLGKGTVFANRRRFRVIALSDNIPLITAWANDVSYEAVFAEQVRSLLDEGDIVFAISCSGNSPNVLNALRVARDGGAFTIGLSGFNGGQMIDLCDLCLVVPSDNMQLIEDLHLSISHCVFTGLRHRLEEVAAETEAPSDAMSRAS